MNREIIIVRTVPGTGHSDLVDCLASQGQIVISTNSETVAANSKVATVLNAIQGSNYVEVISILLHGQTSWSPIMSWALSKWRDPALKGKPLYIVTDYLSPKQFDIFPNQQGVTKKDYLVRRLSAEDTIIASGRGNAAPMSKAAAVAAVNMVSLLAATYPYTKVVNLKSGEMASSYFCPGTSERIREPISYMVPPLSLDSMKKESVPVSDSYFLDKYGKK